MGDEIYYIKCIKLQCLDEEQERHLKLHPLITKLLTRATGWRERECRKERKSVLLRQSRQSRRTRREYASRWHPLKNRQATSGIMRGLPLMCESRVCPLCEANEGKHVRKGWLFT